MPKDYTHAVVILPIRDGRICLCLRKPGRRLAGKYASPAGSIEPGEEVLDAALRELREETGEELAKAAAGRLVYLGKVTGKDEEDWQPVGGHFFLLPLEEGEELRQEEPEKHGPWRWYTYREAAALPLPAISRSFIHLLAHTAQGG